MPEDAVAELERRLSSLVAANAVGDVVHAVRPLTGGASSLTYAADLRRDGHDTAIVVKVAPAGREPVGHRDVLRQARILRSLHASGEVRVPMVLFEDDGDPPAVPPLFAMTMLGGESVEPLFDIDPTGSPTPDDIRARALDAARQLAALQRTSPATVGDAADEVDLTAELARWAAALATVPDADALGWRTVHHELAQAMPARAPLVLGHGDYRLGNMLAVGPTITGVIDWELWAVTDPRIDLAWYRLNADRDCYRRMTALGSTMPEPAQLLQTYVASAGVSAPADLPWFDALARFKATATWSLILKHASRRGSTAFADVAESLPRLLARAGQLLS